MFTRSFFIRILTILTVISGGINLTVAQDEPLYEDLTREIKNKYLNIGILLQTVGDFQIERSFSGNNGFNISNMRIILSGDLDKGFGYLLTTNFINTPAILDAQAYYSISPEITIDVGLFKTPFSKEYLTSASGIDFVNRAMVVNYLAPKRQIGLQIKGGFYKNLLAYRIGIFNGNNFPYNHNDNNRFMYAMRFSLNPVISDNNADRNQLEIGMNSAYSDDDNVSLIGGALPSFSGKRLLLGADIRWSNENIMASAEGIYAHLKYSDTAGTIVKEPFGYHITAGYMISKNSQILVRWESFLPDNLKDDTNLLILGFNFWPTKATELQFNYIIPAKNIVLKHNQFLINVQLAF